MDLVQGSLRSVGGRWFRVLFVLGTLLLLGPSVGTRAQYDEQPLHVHVFDAATDPPIDSPQPSLRLPDGTSVSEAAQPTPGQILSIGGYYSYSDWDRCVGYGNVSCTFPDHVAYNDITITVGATGGELGYLDGYGQFVVDNHWPTHFRCGIAGPASLTMTVDDFPVASDGYNPQIPTNDDPPVSATFSFEIVQHQHHWEPYSNLATPAIQVPPQVYAGERVPVSVTVNDDYDYCTTPSCTFPEGIATNTVRVSSWSGGQFGYVDAEGQFQLSNDPALITTWLAPAAGGDVTLTATVDDVPSAIDGNGDRVATFDDAPVQASATVHVQPVTPPHQHEFQDPADPPIPQPSLSFGASTARTGTIVGVNLSYSAQETDTCRNTDGNCPWPGHSIFDPVHVASASATGGELGTLDGSGSFQPLQPNQVPTCFRCGNSPGVGSITVTLDDEAQGFDPITGQLVSTNDDPPVTVSAVMQVVEHHHQWDGNNLQPGTFTVGDTHPVPYEQTTISLSPGSDTDLCSAPDCPFGGAAANAVRVTSVSGAGSFGYLDAVGNFVPTNNPAYITTWIAPASPGVYTLTATFDDDPEAVNPETGAWEPTYDDTPRQVSVSVTVNANPPPHSHVWQPVNDLVPGSVSVPSTVQTGDLVPVSWAGGGDTDHCLASDCPFGGGAANAVRVVSWGGGTFGYRDGYGDFQASSDPALITHWKAPDTAGEVEISVTVQDVPQAVNPRTGHYEDTYADGTGTARKTVLVTARPHTHDWVPVNDIPAPTFLLPTSVHPGDRVALSVSLPTDGDQCRASGCPLPGGRATNQTHVVSWSGGLFGYYDEFGNFIPSGDPDLITHWQAPDTPGAVTLTAVVDDIPSCLNPVTNVLDGTYDDAPVTVSASTTVSAATAHQHDWVHQDNLALPELSPGNADPYTEDLVALIVQLGGDLDHCRNSGCSFPQGDAANTTYVASWSDGNAGGSFGYMQEQQFVVATDPAQVTHYRCPPSAATVTLTATVDDQYHNVIDPSTQLPIDTYDDAPVTGSCTVRVHSRVHEHHWVSNGNQAWALASLYRNGELAHTIYRGELLEIRLGEVHPDWDICDAPGCPFPGGRADEDPALNRPAYFIDDIHGQFGTVVGGEFVPLAPTDVDHITHYLAGMDRNGDVAHVGAVMNDAGMAPLNGQDVATEKDTPDPTKGDGRPCRPLQSAEEILWRLISGEDSCGCKVCRLKQPIQSDVDPLSGGITFEVPVTSWPYLGTELGLTLHYNSDSRADPRLETADAPGVSAQPDRGHLSQHNSKWTHTWAQFVEVVSDGAETHALWHTGDGGAVSYLINVDPQTQAITWSAEDSYHGLTSSGQANTFINVDVLPDGADHKISTKVSVTVPYGKFTATDGAGTTYTFDQVYWEKGKAVAIPYFLLHQVTDRWGRTVNLSWDADGYLRSVRDGANRGLDFTYRSSDGMLASIQDPWGRTHTLGYTPVNDETGASRSKLSQVTVLGPGNPRPQYVWQFGYGNTGTAYSSSYTGDLVTAKTEPDGKLIHYEYEPVNPARSGFDDWDGRMTQCWWVDNTGAAPVTKSYTRQGTTIAFPGGNSYTYNYQGSELESIRQDSTGRTIHYSQDSLRNPTSVRINNDPPLATVAYSFDADNRTILGTRVTDALGHISDITFGPYHLPLLSTVHGQASGYDLVTQFLYGDHGNLTQVVQQPATFNLSTTLSYGTPSAPALPDAVQDSLGRVSTVEYDTFGRAQGFLSPVNRLAPLGSPDYLPTTNRTAYDADGTPYQFTDAVNRRVEVSYGAGAGGTVVVNVRNLSDNTGRQMTLDAAGRPIHVVDENSVRTDLKYNVDGQVIEVDEAGAPDTPRVTRYEYDLNGNLTAIIPPKGESGRVTFEYTRYDEQGNPDPNHTYEGQVTHIHHPDNTDEYFGYGADGNLVWESRPYPTLTGTQWSTIRYFHDSLYRVTEIDYPASPQGQPAFTVHVSYDEFGRTSSVTDPTGGTTTYEYDALNRLTRVTPSGGRRSATFQYVPDGMNQRWITRTTLGGVGGPTWESREDSKGRFSGVVNPFGQEFHYEYNPDGSPARQVNANSTTTTFTYLPNGLLDTLTHLDRFGQPIDRFTHTYDNVGRLLSETDAGNRVHRFSYDVYGELVDEQHPDLGPGGIQYEYDANGNRTRVVRNGQSEYYHVDAADKLLWTNTAGNTTPTSGQSGAYNLFDYDAFGQMVRRDRGGPAGHNILDFYWDADGRLRSVQNGMQQKFTALYDEGGERVSKTDATGSHVYSGGLQDDLSGGNGLGPITYTPGFSQRQGSQDRFYHSDHLGSTRYLTDSQGGADPAGLATLPSALRYDAYGNRSQYAGTDSDAATRFLYAGAAGYEADADELGIQYLSQRYYDPQIGRFLTRDPIGWAGGLNLYRYCSNDPVDSLDPSGLWELNLRWRENIPRNWARFKNGVSWLASLPGQGTAWLYHHAVKPLWACKMRANTVTLQNANSEAYPQLGAFGRDLSDGIDRVGEEATGAAVTSVTGVAIERLGAEALGAGASLVAEENLPKGGTYLLRDPETNEVMRTGRTCNLARREREHGNVLETERLIFEVDRRTDSYFAQRGREAILYERYPNAPLNRCPALSPKHPLKSLYMKAAQALEE